jgi:hypothetical protein
MVIIIFSVEALMTQKFVWFIDELMNSQVAMSYHQYQTCEFLIEQGAEKDVYVFGLPW